MEAFTLPGNGWTNWSIRNVYRTGRGQKVRYCKFRLSVLWFVAGKAIQFR